jgi:4-amino-4-deoxy-L-arabinose transferase-like glycosyltransferase
MFLRFYKLEERLPFGWDQVRDAWVMRWIVIDGKWPLLGPVAKLNAFNVGVIYYYLLLPFYYVFKLDPIAGGIFAGVVSTITWLILFYVTKKIFSYDIALLAAFIYAVSFYIVDFDRTPWNVDLIPLVSLIVFYSLYRISEEEFIFIPIAAAAAGFAFHVHFTAIFYPLIILLAFPLLPSKKKVIKYAIFSLPVFLVWFIPNIISELITTDRQGHRMLEYIQTYYHGLHLRRVLQLAKDAFIEFETLLMFKLIKPLKYILFPLFSFIYLLAKPTQRRFTLVYFISLWFLIPWFVFSLYSGEITIYYFASTRPIVAIILAFLTTAIFKAKNLVLKTAIVCFWLFYLYVNLNKFLNVPQSRFISTKESAKQLVERGETVPFEENNPTSYLYHMYADRK